MKSKLNINKPNKQSAPLQVELFKYFLIFSGFLITILWIFEITLLDFSYRYTRTNDIIDTAKSIASSIKYGSIDEMVNSTPIEQGVAAVVVDKYENRYLEANSELLRNLVNVNNYKQIILEAISEDNFEDEVFFLTKNGGRLLKQESNDEVFKLKHSKDIGALMYVTHTFCDQQHPVTIIVFGSLEPIETTKSTLRSQLMMITVMMVLISSFISFFAAKRIAKPIENITTDAEQLAEGNYDTNFNGSGYREIEDLSATLNTMATQLDKVNQMQKDLIANVSHDLRTPLTMISGYGELIRDIPEENNTDNIQVIIDEANRLASLVNNLLDISKLQSQAESLTLKSINLKELIDGVYNSYSGLIKTKGYDLVLDLTVEDCYVNGDSIRLQQVLYNLINNAINHCGDDLQVIIKLSINDKSARVDVIDHGEGISEENQKLIWQRYYKAHNAKRYEAGSGLGLSIVKTILDLHNAKYGVISKVNEGSDFYFELPIE